jgi:MFS family permease
MLAFNFFYVSFPVYAVQGLEWSVKTTGAFFALMSFLMVLVQGPLLGRLSKVIAERTLIIVGGLILSLSFLLFTAREDGPIFAGAALLALGNGLMWPSIVAVLSKRAGDQQGAVQGLAGSGGAVASILGLVLGGILYGFVDGWIFGLSFALVLLVVLLSLGLPRRAGG